MNPLFDTLFAHIEEKVALTDADKQLLPTYFQCKQLKRKQLLLQEGSLCKYMGFVAAGLTKSYTTDHKGTEHINQFAWEGWWISDAASFHFGEEAQLSIDAVEPTSLLLLTKEAYENLLTDIPVMERYFRILYQNSLATKDQRLASANTHTAEEKYAFFLQSYPAISQRIPQNLIASYLGLSPETVSRIKNKANHPNS